MTNEVQVITPVLMHNGTIHSTVEPYAEAMLVEDGLVAWLGSDETAERLRDERFAVQDLDRALVVPGFTGWAELAPGSGYEATARCLDEAWAQGYTAARLNLPVSVQQLDSPALTGELSEVLHATAAHPVDVYPVVSLSGVAADGGAPSIAPVNLLLDLIEKIDDDDRPAAVALDLAEVLPNLLGVRSWCAEAGRQLLLDARTTDPGVAADAMVTTQQHLRDLKQTPPPSVPTVLVGFDSAHRSHWEQLLDTASHVVLRTAGHLATALSVGVPTSAAPGVGENPWGLIAEHVHHPENPVSVRAGFNAQTRGAYRSLVGATALAGQLNPGTAATYGIWEVDSLAVQTPSSTVSAWSTDTRARTPLLPYLESAEASHLPRLVSTVIQGTRVY